MKKEKTLVLILILAVFATFLFAAQPPVPQSILAVSSVYIDPQYGYEDPATGEWVGSYWMVLSTTSSYDQHIFYDFNDVEATKYGQDTVGDKQLMPEASISIRVDVARPYVESSVTVNPYKICPDTWGRHFVFPTGSNTKLPEYYAWDEGRNEWVKKFDGPIPQTSVTVKETVGDWLVHIPLRFTVTKIDDENNVVQLVSDDLQNGWWNASGPSALKPIWFYNPENPDERMKVKLEGQLGTGFSFNFPDMLVFADRSDMVFEKTAELLNDMRYESYANQYAYINYWYSGLGLDGEYVQGWRTNDDGSIYVHDTSAKGIFGQTGFFENWEYPLPMYIYEDPPLINGQQYKGMIHYLTDRHRKLENWEVDKWGVGWQLGDDYMRVNLPFNSYLWLYTLQISTELADTYVYQPSYTDGEILSARWASSNGVDATISDQDQLAVTVENIGTVEGNLWISYEITPLDAPLMISGDGKQFQTGEVYTFQSTAKNLGPQNEVTGSINIQLINDAGDIRDEETVTFTLLPITGVTTLNVKVVDKSNTARLLSGISISVQYGVDSQLKTSTSGWATFELGSYQGPVEVIADETSNYYGEAETGIVETGSNLIELRLQAKQSGEADYTWLLILAAIGSGTVIVIVILKKKKSDAP